MDFRPTKSERHYLQVMTERDRLTVSERGAKIVCNRMVGYGWAEKHLSDPVEYSITPSGRRALEKSRGDLRIENRGR